MTKTSPVPISTRHVFWCKTFFEMLILTCTLYVGSGISWNSVGGVSNCMSSYAVVDSSIRTIKITIYAQFSTPWPTCSSDLVRFRLLSPIAMTHIANFSSVSPGLTLVLILPPRILDDPSWGSLFSSTNCSAWGPIGSRIFHAHRRAKPFNPPLGDRVVCSSQLLCFRCWEYIAWRWWTRMYTLWPVIGLYTSRKSFQVLRPILSELGTKL